MPARGPRRRAIIAAIPVAAGLAACTSPRQPQPAALDFFTEHQAAVFADSFLAAVLARIAVLLKGDATGDGIVGVADVFYLINNLFAGGPWSNRHTSGPDLMARFTPLDPVARIAWRKRIIAWQDQYAKGITALDQLAGGDFTTASHAKQDKILATRSVGAFTSLLFEHTIEGLYASPEYGGNKNLAGWKEIGFPGDIQPRGYSATEVERSDGHDPVDSTGIVADVLKLLGAL